MKKECKNPNCGGDGYLRDGPWGNGVPCVCHPSEVVDGIDTSEWYKTDEREPLIKEPHEIPTLSEDVAVSGLEIELLQKYENLLKPPSFRDQALNVFVRAKNWLIEKEKALVERIPVGAKVFARRQFYKYKTEVIYLGGLVENPRIIFHLEPNWLGRRLGYKKDRKAYYRDGHGWMRVFGQVHEGYIPLSFSKKLDVILAKSRIAKDYRI